MKFYFYTNKNVLFDFLARNIIAPDSIVKDIKRYRTISSASDHFLFVTHKKLDRKSREWGIAEPEFVYPVTLELSKHENDGQAVLVSKSEAGAEYACARLIEYDPEKHVGAYLLGEIPLSRIEKIYFDTQNDQDVFSRPSPDYWYPKNKYALLPEGFTEELALTVEEEKIVAASGLGREEIISSLRKREKQRAAVLNFINGTKTWQYDRYRFNMDGSMQKLLGLKDEDVSAVLPHYAEAKGTGNDNEEKVCLVGEAQEQGEEFNQKIYNHVRDVLIDQPYDTQKQLELITEILKSILEKIKKECESSGEFKIVQELMRDIWRLISDASDKGPEEIMKGVPESINVLNALLFVVKNPNKYDHFLDALDAYHADLRTKRRAATLWGALNGLYGMPGEGFNKDNQQLWQFIEGFVYAREGKTLPSLAVTMPTVTVEQGVVLGIRLGEERIVTAEEVREVMLAAEHLPDTVYGKLFESAEVDAGSKKKAENKGYAHSVASIDLPEIKKGDVLNADFKKALAQLMKDCKESKPNKDKLFTDYVKDASKFASVFNRGPDFWKRLKATLEKKNA